jgi:hypothetical protein
VKVWATPVAGDERAGATQGTVSLGRQVRRQILAWPTATAGDAKASGSRNAEGSTAHQGVSLSDMATTGDSRGRLDRPTPKGGPTTSPRSPISRLQSLALNPCFVEALMGFPTGWTDFEHSEMPSSLTAPSSPGASSGAA